LAPISLESAHGKWEWLSETPGVHNRRKHDPITNEPIPNIVSGRDSLFVCGTYVWRENGIYYSVYPDGRIGSTSSFFTPFKQQDFNFLSNPSSNIMSHPNLPPPNLFPRDKVSDFALKDFRVENGITKVDLIYGDGAYVINENTTIKADELTIDKTFTITNNAIVKIVGPSKLYLRNGAQINVVGGSQLIAENVTFEFGMGQNYEINGIYVSENGKLSLKNCIINNPYAGVVSINPQNIDIQSCQFNNCLNSGIVIYNTINCPIFIKNNTITSDVFGIYLSSISTATIDKNTITSQYGILLHAVQNFKVTYNTLTKKMSPSAGFGIYSLSSVGDFYRNNIGTFSTYEQLNFLHGMLLVRSDAKLGKNNVHNSYLHGLYLNSFSRAQLHPMDLSTNMGVTFDIGGCNEFYDNGQQDHSSQFYNSELRIDDSYIYFNGADRFGYNTIKDDRSGVYNQCPLISGTGLGTGQTSINARYTYWGNSTTCDPLFTRFIEAFAWPNNIIQWDPKLVNPPTTECLNAGPEYEIYADYYGNIIDTIYSRPTNPINLTQLEELLIQAYEYLEQGQLEEAKNLYTFIIENYGDNTKCLDAYYKLLAILYRTNAGTEEYQQFIQNCQDAHEQTNDTSFANFLDDIQIPANVCATDFQNAINGLNQIILNMPNTDRAVFAEIEQIMIDNLQNISQVNKPMKTGDNYILSNVINTNKKVEQKLNSFIKSLKITDNIYNNPNHYSLSANYPNPFNPSTKIDFELFKEGYITLKVYDILGNEVNTLVDEHKKPGSYSIHFNASNLPSGVYYYKMDVNGFTSTRKMLLIK
jgi:tetratricopeptide (TPR) repeat protein